MILQNKSQTQRFSVMQIPVLRRLVLQISQKCLIANGIRNCEIRNPNKVAKSTDKPKILLKLI